MRVSTTASDATTADVWASYVTPGGEVYFSVIDTSIPGTNPFDDMVPGQQYEFTEYLLAPSETLAQGVLAITTDGRTSFVALQ